ncbi:MAG: divergent polysaccharide deacetylase family protein [Deltaproteobacteria bacterium]|nr:divergent polysaccharide deacetylase family protein [Deltaproteobacteria bacterium]
MATRSKTPTRNTTRKKTSGPAKAARKRKSTKRPSKNGFPWTWFTYLGLFSLMLICFGVGFWVRPYVEKWSRTEEKAPPKKPSSHISRKSIPTPSPSLPPIKVEKETEIEVTPQENTVQVPETKQHFKKICIILDDFGFNLTSEVREILELDPGITVAILPDRPFSREVMELAGSLGHEILIHAPFEGRAGSTEKQYIHKGDTSERIHALLEQWHDSLPRAVGINNHQGSAATADAATMDSVMTFLKRRNLLFVDSWTAKDTVGFRMAKLSGVPYGARIVPFLDNDGTREEVHANLEQLLEKTGNFTVPIAIGHVTKKATREVLMEVVPRLESMGYKLAPITEAVRQPS